MHQIYRSQTNKTTFDFLYKAPHLKETERHKIFDSYEIMSAWIAQLGLHPRSGGNMIANQIATRYVEIYTYVMLIKDDTTN